MNYMQAFSQAMRGKLAAPRAVKEWRKDMAAGNTAGADQIAQGYGQANLKPRYLKDISGGGMEAGVDLQMGRAGGPVPQAKFPAPNESGYIARKLYKPDSPITAGAGTSLLLDQKQQYTDAARSISPEAKAMVPAMYSSKTQGTPGMLRHTSEHEYVPGMKPLPERATLMNKRQGAVRDLERTVSGPMAERGLRIGDVPFTGPKGKVMGNASNLMVGADGKPRLPDFIPQGAGRAALMDARGEKIFASTSRRSTGYGSGNMNELRREVFRPQRDFSNPLVTPRTPVPAASGVAQRAGSSAAATITRDAATAVHAPQAIGRSAATAVAGKGRSALKSLSSLATKVHK